MGNLLKLSESEQLKADIDSRIEKWMEAMAESDSRHPSDNLHGGFRIWSEEDRLSLGRELSSADAPRVDQVLQDVSNLRQPGYLKKNSFFQDKAQEQVPRTMPTPSRGAAIDRALDILEGRLRRL